MPYSNVPKSKWPKMERCVAKCKTRQGGKAKGRYNCYAVCYTSIVGKKRKRKKKKK